MPDLPLPAVTGTATPAVRTGVTASAIPDGTQGAPSFSAQLAILGVTGASDAAASANGLVPAAGTTPIPTGSPGGVGTAAASDASLTRPRPPDWPGSPELASMASEIQPSSVDNLPTPAEEIDEGDEANGADQADDTLPDNADRDIGRDGMTGQGPTDPPPPAPIQTDQPVVQPPASPLPPPPEPATPVSSATQTAAARGGSGSTRRLDDPHAGHHAGAGAKAEPGDPAESPDTAGAVMPPAITTLTAHPAHASAAGKPQHRPRSEEHPSFIVPTGPEERQAPRSGQNDPPVSQGSPGASGMAPDTATPRVRMFAELDTAAPVTGAPAADGSPAPHPQATGMSVQQHSAPQVERPLSVQSSVMQHAAPAEQIAPALARVAQGPAGTSRLTVRLDPAELGHVEIRIDRATDHTANIRITVARPETLQLLLHDQPRLERALDMAGLPQVGRDISFHLALATPPGPQTAPAQPDPSGTGGLAAHANNGHPTGGDGGSYGQPHRHGTAPGIQNEDDDLPFIPSTAWLRAGLDITA